MESSTLFAVRRALRPDAHDTARLWAAFVQTRDGAVREQLLAAYMEYARMMAAKVYARRTYTTMDFADYLQYATVGLIEAIDRFDPERGYKFETFAARRIIGAMLNGIETSSEVQQQIVARKRVLGQRVASLSDAPGKAAGADDVFSRLADIAVGLAVGLALENSGMHQFAYAESADNSYTGVEMKQLESQVRQAVLALPANQRKVIEMHYLQQCEFEEVAEAMALTRGRISQIHKQALGSLKSLLKHGAELDVRF
jgi:RNA polymerase sigma factor FliA